jgi:uncharacterized protein YkwD
MKRFYVALLALLVALGAVQIGVAAPSSPNFATHSAAFASTGYCADAEDVAFLQLINNYRAQNGLGPLALSQKLADASYVHSADMAAKNYFSHTFADGTSWDQNIRNFGYTYNTSMGENIAAGYSTASTVFTAWKNSSGHNANMLNSSYKAIGIARAYNSSSTYGWYWTTDFGGVVDASGAICGGSTAPTATPTTIPTPTKTSTPKPTATKTPTPKATATKSPTPKATATKSPTPKATATKTPTPKATATKTATPKPATPTATNAPAVTSYVASLSGSSSSGAISVTATIRDSQGRPVSGAAVTVAITVPKGSVQTLTATTDSRGQAKVTGTANEGEGRYRASVANVSAANRPYDPGRNRASAIAITVR